MSARVAALLLLCLSVALIGALAIVASVGENDSLSTIALALAVIAFLVQIIVFVAQTAAAASQHARAEQIYGATLTALKAIEEKTEGTRQSLQGVTADLLQNLIGKTENEAAVRDKSHSKGASDGAPDGASTPEGDSGVKDARPARRVDSDGVVDGHASSRNSDVSARGPEVANKHASPGGNRASRQSGTPDLSERLAVGPREMASIGKSLQNVPGLGLDFLNSLWRDYRRSKAAKDEPGGLGHGLYAEDVVDDARYALYTEGLIKKVKAPWRSDAVVWVLTDRGRLAARLMFAFDDDNVSTEILVARANYTEWQAKLNAFRSRQRSLAPQVPIEDSNDSSTERR